MSETPAQIVWDASDVEMQPLYLAVGRANSKWSNLEHKLALWLVHVAQIDALASMAIYFGPSGFKARMDILKGALRHTELGDPEKEFLDAAIRKATDYSNYRNKIVHGVPLKINASDGSEFVLMEGDYPPTPENMKKYMVRIPQMERAATNFDALTVLVFRATFSRLDPALRIEELQQQVEQLPIVPWNAASDPIETARRQQSQADRARNQAREKT